MLSLFTSKPGYHPRESPRFRVYAVATSAAACRMEYGPGAVRVVVTRHGRVVWDSAACETTRGGSRTVRLVPGVPRETDLSWNRNASANQEASANRKASARSCADALPNGQAGTFQAIARADGHSSPARSFKLLR